MVFEQCVGVGCCYWQYFTLPQMESTLDCPWELLNALLSPSNRAQTRIGAQSTKCLEAFCPEEISIQQIAPAWLVHLL